MNWKQDAIDVRDDEHLLHYIRTEDVEEAANLYAQAHAVRERHYGKAVFFRGLIEFSNYCANDCYYCGLRASNSQVGRYRLLQADILAACQLGHLLGYRTFVLQSGEDPYYTDDRVVELVSAIRAGFPDCAISLSIGERERVSYERFFAAGANRYLLRHESACNAHYQKLHPADMSLARRKQCLRDLKAIGFQTGAGFMVGSPFQTPEHLLEDLHFIRELEPEMTGIGPFIPHAQTPFASQAPGSLNQTLRMVALARLILPRALLPATTALGTIDPKGRELGLLAGANIVMPNLTPTAVRPLYALYDNKICTGDEAAHCRLCIEGRIRSAGFEPDLTRGDALRAAPAA